MLDWSRLGDYYSYSMLVLLDFYQIQPLELEPIDDDSDVNTDNHT